jgi:hypothetical protein
MIKRYFTSAAILAAGMLVMNTARATVLDLNDTTSPVTVNGGLFTTSYTQPAGTGVYDPFLTIQNTPWEQGYNSSTQPFDTKRVPQWNHEIQFSSLQVTTIGTQQYYGFAIDVNEPNGTKSNISLDAFNLYLSSSLQSSTSTNPHTGYFNGSLGTLVYSMGDTSLLYNDQNNGSGQDDIAVFIPVSAFAGAQANDYVYLYQRWGNSDDSQGGFEETRLIAGITPVPEMSALFPIVGLMVAVGSTHILRRRRMARASV